MSILHHFTNIRQFTDNELLVDGYFDILGKNISGALPVDILHLSSLNAKEVLDSFLVECEVNHREYPIQLKLINDANNILWKSDNDPGMWVASELWFNFQRCWLEFVDSGSSVSELIPENYHENWLKWVDQLRVGKNSELTLKGTERFVDMPYRDASNTEISRALDLIRNIDGGNYNTSSD